MLLKACRSLSEIRLTLSKVNFLFNSTLDRIPSGLPSPAVRQIANMLHADSLQFRAATSTFMARHLTDRYPRGVVTAPIQ
jgi:hypothetical protein